MRSDAARRRAAIVREARHLFAETGGAVALETIADAAGVGIATLYRNFESRAALVEQVALAILDDVTAATAEARAALPSAPDQAWRTYAERLVDLDLGALTAALAQDLAAGLSLPVRQAQEQSLSAVEDLLVQVRSAGLMPDDVGAMEFVVALGIVTRPQPTAVRLAAPHVVGRLITLVLAGLQAQAHAAADAASTPQAHRTQAE